MRIQRSEIRNGYSEIVSELSNELLIVDKEFTPLSFNTIYSFHANPLFKLVSSGAIGLWINPTRYDNTEDILNLEMGLSCEHVFVGMSIEVWVPGIYEERVKYKSAINSTLTIYNRGTLIAPWLPIQSIIGILHENT